MNATFLEYNSLVYYNMNADKELLYKGTEITYMLITNI